MQSTLTLSSGGHPLMATTHVPTGTPKGLIVVAYGSDGFTDDLSGPWKTLIEGYAASLVEKGYGVLMPDYLAATGTQPGPGVFEQIGRFRDAWQKALADATDQYLAVSQADPKRIGWVAISYCACATAPRSWSNASRRCSTDWARRVPSRMRRCITARPTRCRAPGSPTQPPSQPR